MTNLISLKELELIIENTSAEYIFVNHSKKEFENYILIEKDGIKIQFSKESNGKTNVEFILSDLNSEHGDGSFWCSYNVEFYQFTKKLLSKTLHRDLKGRIMSVFGVKTIK